MGTPYAPDHNWLLFLAISDKFKRSKWTSLPLPSCAWQCHVNIHIEIIDSVAARHNTECC